MSDVLKFCYLSLCIVFLSCSGVESKKSDAKKTLTPSIEEQEEKLTQKTILFFGNSLTAGMGLEVEEAFPALIQKRLDSLSIDYNVINAGLSGETTAGGKTRIEWILKQPVDIFILELGGNDALRGIDPADSYKNLKFIIEKVKEKYPSAKIVLAGMEAPPNLGPEFTAEFRQMYPKLAKEFNASLIPFLLQDVGGVPELNLPDGIHPTPEGHKIVASNVWSVLKDLL